MAKNRTSRNCFKSFFIKHGLLILVSIFFLLILYFTGLFIRDYAKPQNYNPPIDSNIFGDWGKFVGGIMACGAFIFAFATFMTQRKSIKASDLENNFFKLIGQLQFIVEQFNLQIPTNKDIVIRDKIGYIKYRIKNFQTDKYVGSGRNAIHILSIRMLKEINEENDLTKEVRYNNFYDDWAYQLGHYFRFVYHIIKFIEAKKLKASEQQKYMDLLQAQLSTDEMGLIFYNAALGEKSKKKGTGERLFKKMLDRNKILENIDDGSLADNGDRHLYYPNTFPEARNPIVVQ
jgi:hypothetical protein